jgi:hypothetical protein
MSGCLGWMGAFKVDPGPCPVDDAPHTTCTSPDYTAAVPFGASRTQSVTTTVRRPFGLDPPPTNAPDHTQVEVSTKTYRGTPPLRARVPSRKR